MNDTIQLNHALELNSGIKVHNRLFKSAMSEQLGDKHLNPKPELVELYRVWAEGGIGISVTGNVMVDRSALGEPRNVVLDQHSNLDMFRSWAKNGTQQNTQLWMQLNHPGKQVPAILSEVPVAPSAIPLTGGLEKGFNTPRALTEAEILEIIERFATSASLAKKTGFTGIQIHGAHGYLVSQFLSPRHNQRTDQWGGTPENRMRFVLEVYRAIREKVGNNFPVGIKLNSADFMKDGFTEDESMTVVKALDSAGIDLIEISGGTYESPSMMGANVKESTRRREAYFLEYAEQVRQHVSTRLVVTGGFRSAKAMTEALQSGATDMIGVARPMALQPDLPIRLINDPSYRIELPNPTTGIAAMDQMSMLGITWFEAQLQRIGKKQQPKPKLSSWFVVFQMFAGLGKHAFQKRRA
ncbi:NADH oxidase [Endozoicomonas sp. OPT23]|uniref:NADH:flavin oxidoreductase/NADH oxidase family protein n=1 Tax=Endozoicomonas sp. OPT23 TaxID=2072845 RepID=UPI00129B8462|nr:NADH:flavin oxidoreductase/NADH oxidase family protein [Endozoicomonas sp. OPT23]MRI32746.1 NADH oxidase [Endozoicomonas sp. OPT23]